MGQAFYNAEGILTGVSGIPGVTGPDPSGVGSYNPLYDQSLSAEEKTNIKNQQDIDRRQALREKAERIGLQRTSIPMSNPADFRNVNPFGGMGTRLRGNQGMFGNPYMQRPMFGGGFGGGFNPYQQRPMFGGGFGGGFNPYQQRPMFNPYQQQSMGFGFPRPQPRFNPFGGGFSRGFNPFRPNPTGLFNPQRLGFQNPMSDIARRQSLIAAMNARAQQQQGQAQQAQQVPVATGVRGADAARAMNTARFSGIPQGLGGTAQFQNPTVNAGAADAARAAATAQFSGIPQGLGGTAQFQTQPVSTGAADAARAMATAQFSGDPRQRGMDNLTRTISQNMINSGGTTAPAPATTPTTVPFSGQYMTQAPLGGTYAFNSGAGGGIVPQFGINPMNQQGANTNPGAGGGIVPAFGLNPMSQQGAGGTNQPAAGGTV